MSLRKGYTYFSVLSFSGRKKRREELFEKLKKEDRFRWMTTCSTFGGNQHDTAVYTWRDGVERLAQLSARKQVDNSSAWTTNDGPRRGTTPKVKRPSAAATRYAVTTAPSARPNANMRHGQPRTTLPALRNRRKIVPEKKKKTFPLIIDITRSNNQINSNRHSRSLLSLQITPSTRHSATHPFCPSLFRLLHTIDHAYRPP